MSEIKHGGPAFPVECDWVDGEPRGRQTASYAGWHEGMTLRDYFAAKVMSGLCANEGYNQHSPETLANEAYGMADAMIRAREA